MSTSEVKKDTNDLSLQGMDVKQLLVNIRLNLEKTRGEARSALRQIKDKSHEVNDLILAIDGIQSNYNKRINKIENSLNDLSKQIEYLSTPWYKRLWFKNNDDRGNT